MLFSYSIGKVMKSTVNITNAFCILHWVKTGYPIEVNLGRGQQVVDNGEKSLKLLDYV